jgi:hypothetical protein
MAEPPDLLPLRTLPVPPVFSSGTTQGRICLFSNEYLRLVQDVGGTSNRKNPSKENSLCPSLALELKL